MKYQIELLCETPKGKEWKAMRPTGGQPYVFEAEDSAIQMLRMCYPNARHPLAKIGCHVIAKAEGKEV